MVPLKHSTLTCHCFRFKINRVPEVSYFDAADLLGEVFVDTIDTVSLAGNPYPNLYVSCSFDCNKAEKKNIKTPSLAHTGRAGNELIEVYVAWSTNVFSQRTLQQIL